MRKKKTLKLSINELKKYCPFVKNLPCFYKENENKYKLALSLMSELCPIGKQLNKKHVLLIDDKSKNKVCNILNVKNEEIKYLDENKECKHMVDENEKYSIVINEDYNRNEFYEDFKKQCDIYLKEYITKLHLDKRYRIFTILRKYRNYFPNVYIENDKIDFPLFYNIYQKYGYKIWTMYNLDQNYINENEKTVVWCSNDYLSLSNNKDIINVGIETLKNIGNSSGGTRNISGSLINHSHLEYILAKWYNKESSLLFTSGYVANIGSLEILGKMLNLIYVSDEMNHSSLINGIRYSQCEKYIFKHNNVKDLERVLKEIRNNKNNKNRNVMIVFESIYSMNGNISDIKSITNLAKKYKALTYIDEVHAVGLYGKKGSGYCEQLNLCNEIDIINGTLSKSIGSFGGFICANKYYIDIIRSYSPHFIFTTSLSPVNLNTSAEAIYIIKNNIKLRETFHSVVKKTKKMLREKGIKIMENNSHIIPVLIGCAEKCKMICDDLLKTYNIYLQPINYPTVPKGTERIRITPSALHTDEQIIKLVNSLYILFKKYEVNIFENKDDCKILMND